MQDAPGSRRYVTAAMSFVLPSLIENRDHSDIEDQALFDFLDLDQRV